MQSTKQERRTTRLRALASGKVQGVFFRDFVRRHAVNLGLVGFACNLSNGRTVEVVGEGPTSALKALAEHLRKGPPGAYVEGVELVWGSPTGEYKSFRIL